MTTCEKYVIIVDGHMAAITEELHHIPEIIALVTKEEWTGKMDWEKMDQEHVLNQLESIKEMKPKMWDEFYGLCEDYRNYWKQTWAGYQPFKVRSKKETPKKKSLSIFKQPMSRMGFRRGQRR